MILQNFFTVDKFRTLQLNVCKNAGTPSMLQWSTRTTRLTSTTKSLKNWTTFILNPRHRESEKENEKKNQLSLSGWITLVPFEERWKRRKKMNKWACFFVKVALKLCNIYILYTFVQYTCNMGSDIHRKGYNPIENTALENFQFESTRGVERKLNWFRYAFWYHSVSAAW